jgi:hypothetical protein
VPNRMHAFYNQLAASLVETTDLGFDALFTHASGCR